MSKRNQEHQIEMNQDSPEQKSIEQKLLESVEQGIDELTDQKYHYSIDIMELEVHSVTLGVYGVEGYDLPSRKTVSKALGEYLNWTPGFEKLESTEDHYQIRVLEWEDDCEIL